MGHVLLPAIPGFEIPEANISGRTVPIFEDEFYCAYLFIFLDQVQARVAMPDCGSDCKPVSLLEREDRVAVYAFFGHFNEAVTVSV